MELTEKQQKELDELMELFRKQNEAGEIVINGKSYNRTLETIHVKANSIEDIKNALKTIDIIVPFQDNVYSYKSKCGFVLYLENPPIETIHSPFICKLICRSGNNRIVITFNTSLINDFVCMKHRKLSDTEYHYFVNQNNLHNKEVRAYSFNFKQDIITYQGGYQVSYNQTLNKEIYDFIMK